MRTYVIVLTAILLLARVGSAQVSVTVELDQDQFLPGEAIYVAVKIANRSGQTLHLGAESNWLAFSVEAKDGFVVEKTGDVPVVLPFSLDSSKGATKTVDLAPYFRLSHTGRYTVRAVVRVAAWDESFFSPPKDFDLIGGTKLWDQEFGVPRASGVPEVRRYVLQQANYLKYLRLYARVTDAAGDRCFGVLSLGPLVSFGRPEAKLAKNSELHVLYQTGARAFTYVVVTPDCQIRVRQTYAIASSRPRLAVDETDGNVSVTGGVRQPSTEDLPPSTPQPPPPDDRPVSKP